MIGAHNNWRRAFLVLGLFAVVALWARPAVAERAPAILKPAVLVDGAYVTLGDVFDPSSFADAPDAMGVIITRAPGPGNKVTLDAGRLRHIAATHGLEWVNAQHIDTITVTRTSQVIGAEQIEATIIEALESRHLARDLGGTIRIRFTGATPVLHIAKDAAPSIAIDSLDLDERTGQFRARLRAPADEVTAEATVIAGRAYAIAELPVPARDIGPGDIIRASDFQWTEIPVERIGQNVMTDLTAIIGMTPRRMLRAGQALRLGDVAAPIVVEKNAIVIMIVRNAGMTLTAQGRALESGAMGEPIRVLNTQSKRTISAVVLGPSEVLVGTSTSLASLP